MNKQRKTKDNPEPRVIRQTAAERRAGRETLVEMRRKINGPQCLGEIKANQRRRKRSYLAIKDEHDLVALDALQVKIEIANKIMENQDKTNLSLLRFVMPTLKAVELKGAEGPMEIIVRLPDVD